MKLIKRLKKRRAQRRRLEIDTACPGYSGEGHWKFFHEVVATLPINDICILGVYRGRDIAYIVDAFHRRGRKDFRITGVDLFADVPGADWPDEQRTLSWEEAGHGPAPTLEEAQANLARVGSLGNVELLQSDAVSFLNGHENSFDLIYIDIAHDYESTRDAIRAALPACRPRGYLCGDDYSDEGTWGVKQAVEEACPSHTVHSDWIWLARADEVTLPAS